MNVKHAEWCILSISPCFKIFSFWWVWTFYYYHWVHMCYSDIRNFGPVFFAELFQLTHFFFWLNGLVKVIPKKLYLIWIQNLNRPFQDTNWWPDMTFWQRVKFMVPSDTCSGPEAAKQPKNITLPPACLTNGMIFLWNAMLLLHLITGLKPSKTFNLFLVSPHNVFP